ncbi:MAG: Ig-like domain-containing protein, partial [Acidimicrobiales bacterium]
MLITPLLAATSASAGGSTDALIYVSSTSAGSVPSGPGSAGPTIAFGNEDVLVYDSVADTWAIAFDGSAAGVGGANVDGFSIGPSGDYLISFAGPTAVPGVTGTVDDSDVVTWDGTSFALLIDASDVGLTSGGEDIDAIATAGPSSFVVSTLGSSSVPKTGGGTLAARDEDLLELTTSSTGAVTAGNFVLDFDGSDVGLGGEDIVGAHTDADTGVVYASVLGGFNVGFAGDGDDIVAFTGATGEATSGTFALFFNGDDHDFGREQIDAVHIEFQAGPPQGEADLTVTKTDDADPVIAGDSISYTVTVANAGPDAAINVVAAENLPAGVTFVSTSGCTQDPSGLPTCSLGDIGAGSAASYVIEVTVDQGTAGSITNTVTVTSDSVDPNPGDNSASEDTLVAGLPVAVDDGPATGSVPGNLFHIAVDATLNVASGDSEDLLNNDSLGDPAAVVASFGGGDVGGSVVDNAGGDSVAVGAGSLTVNDDGSFDFTPDTGFAGIFSFEYRLENSGGSSDATVSIFVGDRPTASGADLVYLSMTSTGTIDSLTYSREDIIVYDTGTSTWDVAFDGSDVGLASANIDAFTIVENGNGDTEILFSLSAPTVIPGISPRVDDSDIVRFLGTGGVNTSGSLELFIDGSDVSLRSGGEDVDALSVLDGNYLMSVLGGFNVPATGGGALVGADEDLIEFAVTGTGPVTSGAFSMAFDGSDVDLLQEDLTGAWVDPTDGSVFATSLNGFNVPGLSGDSNDVFVFTPGTTGPDTSGTFSLFFDLDTTSLVSTSKSVDGLHIERRDAPPENRPPDAVDDSGFFVSEDVVLTIPADGVLTNDTDPDTDPLTVTDFDATSTKGATVVVNPDGSFSYDPTNAPTLQALGDETTTEDTFTYTIDDGNGGTDTATVIVVVEGRNDEPDAIDDEYGTDAVTVLTVPISGVLSNDTDAEGATLEAFPITGTSGRGANLILNTDGSFTYDPTGVSDFADLAAGETLTDTFSYTMTDGAAGFDSATVTITVTGVNDDPVADDDSYLTDADAVLEITPSGVLVNDEDPDTSDVLTVQSHDPTSAAGATVVVNADGSFSYDPTGVAALQGLGDGEEQDDTFEYTVSDGNGGTDTATVTVTVLGVNDDPVAVDDNGGETDEDTILNVLVPGVLDNDTDPDGDTLLVDVFASDPTSVEGAAITLNADGSFSYNPTAAPDLQALAADESVDDSFTYTVSDGNGGTDTATVTITVTGVAEAAPPVAVDDTGATDEDTAIAVIASPTQGLLANDTDPNGDPLTVSASDATSAEGATVTVSPDGGYTYNPIGAAALQGLALDQTVQDTFEYTVSDGNGGTDTAIVTITVTGLNDDPVAVDDIDDADQDFLLTVAAPGVLDNDTDADGDSLTVSTSDTASAEGAIVSVSSDGSFTYDPRTAPSLLALDGNTCVDDTFTYTVSDSNGGTDTATVTVNVCGVGDDPDAVDDFDATDEDTAIAVIASPTQGLLVNDTDPENDPLTVSAFDATSTQGATVTVSPDGGYTYDPSSSTALQALAAGVTVDDTFTYEVDDGTSRTDTATVTVTVTGVNDDPVAVDDDYSTGEDLVLTVSAEAAGAMALGSSGSGVGVFSAPHGVAVDGAGNVVVSEIFDDRVQVCD